jgi:hypothetical protein
MVSFDALLILTTALHPPRHPCIEDALKSLKLEFGYEKSHLCVTTTI